MVQTLTSAVPIPTPSPSNRYLRKKNARTQRTGAAKAAEMNRYILKREIQRLKHQAGEGMAKYNKALAVNEVCIPPHSPLPRQAAVLCGSAYASCGRM